MPPANTGEPELDPIPPAVALSARTGEGLEELSQAVEALFPREAGSGLWRAASPTSGRLRPPSGLWRGCAGPGEALAAGVTPDALLTDVEEALEALGELTGQSVREDVTARIFQRFCVGK